MANGDGGRVGKGACILDRSVLDALAPFPFYYPYSGGDFREAIDLFSPHIREFIFVDIQYFVTGMTSADDAEPILKLDSDYELIEVDLDGSSPSADFEELVSDTGTPYRHIDPYTRSEHYRHNPSGQEIVVRRRRGDGLRSLEALVSDLGIFYYRGDSSEGSRSRWLTVSAKKHARGRRYPIDAVLDRMVNNGLFVTDGSWCEWGEYIPFRSLQGCPLERVKDAIEHVEPFMDCRGFSFRCIGYAGWKNGPTLIWQVTRPGHS